MTRYPVKEKPGSATFAIYKKDDISNPLIFIAQTENLLFDWVTQISIYCARLFNFFSLHRALALTTSDGNVYFGLIDKSHVHYIKQA